MSIARLNAVGGAMPCGRLSVLRRLLSLSPNEASFQSRGFTGRDPSKQSRLESIGRTFIAGYNAAIAANDIQDVLKHVATIGLTERGFAAEGAAMGAAMGDALSLRGSLLPKCIAAFRWDFTYLVHVGAGWSFARVPWRANRILAVLDPIHRWLAFDGLGFHDTYFHHRRILGGWQRKSSGYAARAYDQGIGRALWFVAGGSATDAVDLVTRFSATRQGDLWSGLGLAMAYAGPADDGVVAHILSSADAYRAHYAQGVAFACEARALQQHVPTHTDLAARVVCGLDAESLARLVRNARDRLPQTEGDLPRYELWRRDVAAVLGQQKVRPA